jgi:hypothetical protein
LYTGAQIFYNKEQTASLTGISFGFQKATEGFLAAALHRQHWGPVDQPHATSGVVACMKTIDVPNMVTSAVHCDLIGWKD